MKNTLYLSLLFFSSLSPILAQESDLEKSTQNGREIYNDFCITCHLDNGQGVEGVFPPLAKSDYLINNRTKSIFGIKYGQTGEIIVNGSSYNNTMMSMGLEDQEIADVMNFITNSWGNKNDKIITVEEVSAVIK